MKFKIIKKVENTGTWYWTIPTNFFAKLWYILNPFALILYLDKQNPWDCWFTLKESKQHIERWNNGYYKKKYYNEEIKQ